MNYEMESCVSTLMIYFFPFRKKVTSCLLYRAQMQVFACQGGNKN